MGIDGIEFHPRYQQNLGTFQEVWLFQKKCLAQKNPKTPKPHGDLKYETNDCLNKEYGADSFLVWPFCIQRLYLPEIGLAELLSEL